MLTRNRFGKGQAYYVASSPDAAFLRGFMSNVCEEQGIKPLLDTPAGIEVVERVKEGTSLLFIMNHNAEAMAFDAGSANQTDLLTERPVTGHVTIPARGVMILERPAADGSEL